MSVIFSTVMTILIVGFAFGVLLYQNNFLRFLLLVYLYPAVCMLFVYLFESPTHTISSGWDVYSMFIGEALFLYLIGYLCFAAALWPARTESFAYKAIYFDSGITFVGILLLLLFVVLAFPWTFGLTGHRQGILAGDAWNSVYVAIFVILNLSIRNGSIFLRAILLAIPAYLVINGERADSIFGIVVVLLLVYKFNYKKFAEVISEPKVRLTLIPFLILFLVATSIGILRDNDLSIDLLLQNVVMHLTVVDVTHIYFSAFSYVDEFGHNMTPLKNLAYSLIPFHPESGGGSHLGYTMILRTHLLNYGGGLYVAEAYLMFGVLGIVFYSYFLGRIYRYFFMGRSYLSAVLFLVLFVFSLRIMWYGLSNGFKPLMVSTILVLCIYFFESISSRPLQPSTSNS